MVSLEKLKVIAKAKFSDKSKLGEWYKLRNEICATCPLNSTNKKELTLKEKAMVAANFGKPTCTACGCEIAAKTSVRSEQCGLIYKGEEPLWPSLPEITDFDFRNINIKNLNADKANLLQKGTGIELDYGRVPHGFDSKVQLALTSKEGPISAVKVVAGCGCTTTNSTTKNGEAIVTIGYDTIGRKGGATKNVTIYYTLGGEQKNLMCKLQIYVENKN